MTRRCLSIYAAVFAVCAVTVGAWVGGCKGQPQQQAAAPTAAGQGSQPAGQGEAKPAAKETEKGHEPPPAQTVGEAKRGLEGQDPMQIQKAIESLSGVIAKDEPVTSAEAAAVLKGLLKTGTNPLAREGAVRAFAPRPDKYIDIILSVVADKDEKVRIAAIGTLARCSPGSKGEKKLEELSQSSDALVRTAAVGALTAVRAKSATGDKYAALVSQLGIPDGDASAQATIQLKLAGPDALKPLEKAIRSSTNPRRRQAATMCVALICAGTNPTEEKFAALAKVEKKDTTPVPQSNPRGFPILAYAVKDEDPATREIAAQGLGYLGDQRAAPLLAAALKDRDVHVRRRAAAALVTTPAKPVQAAIADAALHDRDAAARRFAVEALGWIGDSSVVPALSQACSDSSPDVRRYAAAQLGRLKDPAGLEALVRLFKDKDEDVRWAAVKAVGDLRDRRARERLVEALDDPAPQVSTAAEAGLQQLGIGTRNLPGAK